MAFAKSLVAHGLHLMVARLIGGAGSVATGLSGAGTSSQANAYPIQHEVNVFSTVASNSGARLPDYDVGDSVTVVNGGANALLVYPHVGGAINAAATNAALSVASGKSATFRRVSNTLWIGAVSA